METARTIGCSSGGCFRRRRLYWSPCAALPRPRRHETNLWEDDAVVVWEGRWLSSSCVYRRGPRWTPAIYTSKSHHTLPAPEVAAP